MRNTERFAETSAVPGTGLPGLDAFNVLNRVDLLFPNATFGSEPTPLPTFGSATGAGDPRQIQLGVRVTF